MEGGRGRARHRGRCGRGRRAAAPPPWPRRGGATCGAQCSVSEGGACYAPLPVGAHRVRPSHGLDDRRRAVGATVIVALLTAPHAEETRTQYCVAAVTGAVISVGELRPTGFVKSNTGPWYHWYDSDAPAAATVRRALAPAVTLTSDGCATIAGALHEPTTFIVTA